MSTPLTAPAVVLGLGQNGLATVRALGRAGIPVIGVDDARPQPTARSRYCQHVVCPGFREGGTELLRTLEALGPKLPAPGVLFPSGDTSLICVSEHRDRLARWYRFRMPSRETIRLVLNKEAFQGFGEAHGIPLPRTIPVTAGLDVARLAGTLRFPCIVKPRQPDVAWRRRNPDRKGTFCTTPAELIAEVAAIRATHAELLIQEFIPGGEDHLHFSLTYLDGQGQPLGMFTGRKLRQYPPRLGTSCLAESYRSAEVADRTLAILRALDYQGYGSIEFKRDAVTGEFFVIEVTPRTWFPHGLATACGVNLPLIAYREQLGLPVTPAFEFPDRVRWIHEERDLQVAWAAWRSGSLSLRDWLASYRAPRTYALTARDDLRPILALARSVAARSVAGLARRVRPRRRPAAVEAPAADVARQREAS